MTRLSIAAALLCAASPLAAATVSSPDGRITVTVETDGEGIPFYEVALGGKPLIGKSVIAFNFTDEDPLRRGLKVEGYDGGFWVGPTLFDNVTKDMTIYKEEIFGPVLSVLRAENYDEALRLCSEHEFGNGVAIFTRDGDSARDFASRVQVGMVGINVPIPVPIAYYTFGGWKASGFGDLNQHGADAFRFYTKTKTVTTRWPSGIRTGASFVMPEGS